MSNQPQQPTNAADLKAAKAAIKDMIESGLQFQGEIVWFEDPAPRPFTNVRPK